MSETDLDLPDTLAVVLGAGVWITYAQLWAAAVSQRMPAQRVGRYWRIRRTDLPAVIGYFRSRTLYSPSAA
jgi:hypothetical protein